MKQYVNLLIQFNSNISNLTHGTGCCFRYIKEVIVGVEHTAVDIDKTKPCLMPHRAHLKR